MKKALLAALMGAAVLAACGGGGGDDAAPPVTSQVPASASQSVDGFISFLRELVASAADMLEPVDTTNVVPPTDDTSEPQTVD
jgi:hypothetical protein